MDGDNKDMTRGQQTGWILMAILVVGLVALYLHMQSENRAAVASNDYGRCWSEECKSEVAGAAADRLGRGY